MQASIADINRQSEEVLTNNIRLKVKQWKREGTVGSSVNCLKANVSTTGLTCAPAYYHNVFPDIAKAVAKKMRFNLYD